MVAYERTPANLVVVFPCLLGSFIDARQQRVFVSFKYNGLCDHTHDILGRLVLVVRDGEWFQSY
jgi:hypothetical protein